MFSNLLQLPPYLLFADGDQGDNGGDGGKPSGQGDGDNAGAAQGTPAAGDKGGDADGDAPKFTQADLDRVVEERLARDRKARAPKPSDVPKAKATEDADGDQGKAGESDLERQVRELMEEREADRQARTEAEAKALRSEVAESKEVPTALLGGPADSSKEALEKWADQLVEWRKAAPKRRPSSSAIGRTNEKAATKAPVGKGLARIRAGYANADS